MADALGMGWSFQEPISRDPQMEREERRIRRRRQIEKVQEDFEAEQDARRMAALALLTAGAVPEATGGAFGAGMAARLPIPIVPKLALMTLLSGTGAWAGDQLEAIAEDAFRPGLAEQIRREEAQMASEFPVEAAIGRNLAGFLYGVPMNPFTRAGGLATLGGTGLGGAFSAGGQLIQTGRVDPLQTAIDALMSGGQVRETVPGAFARRGGERAADGVMRAGTYMARQPALFSGIPLVPFRPASEGKPAAPLFRARENTQPINQASLDVSQSPLDALINTFARAGAFQSAAEVDAARALWTQRANVWAQENNRSPEEFFTGLKSILDAEIPSGALPQEGTSDGTMNDGNAPIAMRSPLASVSEIRGVVGPETTPIAFSIADQAKVGTVTLPSGATFETFGGPFYHLEGFDPNAGSGNAWAVSRPGIANQHHARAARGARLQFTINNAPDNVLASHGNLAIRAEVEHALKTGSIDAETLYRHIVKTVKAHNATNKAKKGEVQPVPFFDDFESFLNALLSIYL